MKPALMNNTIGTDLKGQKEGICYTNRSVQPRDRR